MRRFVYQLVERLHEPDSGLSRNRHFALLSSPAGKRALKLFRHLRSLEQNLARHKDAKLSLEPKDSDLEVRLEIPSLKLVQTARLTPEDVRIVADGTGPLAEALRQRS